MEIMFSASIKDNTGLVCEIEGGGGGQAGVVLAFLKNISFTMKTI